VRAARRMMSRCPFVTGSKDPGQIAFFKDMFLLRGRILSAAYLLVKRHEGFTKD
jgi:hypothetical protein